MNVAIYCGSAFGNNQAYQESTKILAKKLAQKNFNIVYGGSVQGLMGVISNESISNGNKVYGVITYDLIDKEIENKNITEIYKVNTINERKEKMEELSDAFISLPGGYGTLEEMTEVLSAAQIGYHQKPCAFYNVNGYYDKFIEFLKNCASEGFLSSKYVDMIIVTDDADELIERIANYKAPKSKWEN